MTPNPSWRKSSRSQNDANCVELRGTLTEVRDSKNVDGPRLQADVSALVRLIQTGRFDQG